MPRPRKQGPRPIRGSSWRARARWVYLLPLNLYQLSLNSLIKSFTELEVIEGRAATSPPRPTAKKKRYSRKTFFAAVRTFSLVFFAAPPWYSYEWCLWPLLHESNSERQHRRAQKDVFRGSNLGPQYLYTGLAYAPTEAGFVHGAPPHMWYSWSRVQKTIFPRFCILVF